MNLNWTNSSSEIIEIAKKHARKFRRRTFIYGICYTNHNVYWIDVENINYDDAEKLGYAYPGGRTVFKDLERA